MNLISGIKSFFFSRVKREPRFYSRILGASLFVDPRTFWPDEAEKFMLPIMKSHPQWISGKRVLEIGTGAGLVSLYAQKLGAKKVIATDINKHAIFTLEKNKNLLSNLSVIETRYVKSIHPTAYEQIKPKECFDLIISNPPYSLDIEAKTNNAFVDSGVLGISLIKQLKQYLSPDGICILLFRSPFYHQFIIKYANFMGYHVRHYAPDVITPWEFETLAKTYLHNVFKKLDLPQSAFDFRADATWMEAQIKYPKDNSIEILNDPLIVAPNPHKFPGIILIKNKTNNK